ncbi:MAG: PASTA domain-containing protein, partial [Micromonosporaceae bacterium]
LATGKQRLQVVEVGPGSVWVVNTETGEVWRVPTDTMRPEKMGGERAEDEKKPMVVAGGGQAYLIDPEKGTVTGVDGKPDQRRDVTTPAPVDEAVVDSSGRAWALARSAGELYQIGDGKLLSRHRVTRGNEPLTQLTLAADHPVVYRPAAGQVLTYRHQGLLDKFTVPPVSTPVRVPSSPVAAPMLVAVVSGAAELYTVNLRTGKSRNIKLQGREDSRFGAPAVLGDLAYVPDQTRRQVVLVELDSMRLRDPVTLPDGADDFEIFVRDRRVWVNDPYAKTMLVFDRLGRPTKIDRAGKPVDDESDQPPRPDAPNPKPDPEDSPQPPPAAPPVAPPADTPRPDPQQPKVSVPDVLGMDRVKACQQLKAVTLKCVFVSRQDASADTGEVVETDPTAGSEVAEGTQVTLYHAGPTQVPYVVGMSVEDACETLRKARLVCSKNAQGVADSPDQMNKVYAQQPEQGTPMTSGSQVTVTHPTPGWIKVPSLVGAAPDQACATVQSYGLTCAPDPNEQTWQPNVVHNQGPGAGTAVQQGSQVSYVYQDNGPVLLDRWKLDNREVRYLAPRGQTPPPVGPTWHPQNAMGGVYTSSDQVPGLVWVYRHRCSKDCGRDPRDVGFKFSPQPDLTNPQWKYEGPAFACFNAAPGATPPQGTRRLVALFHDSWKSWAYAVEGTEEMRIHRDAGYQPRNPVCSIWYGVPGFPS